MSAKFTRDDGRLLRSAYFSPFCSVGAKLFRSASSTLLFAGTFAVAALTMTGCENSEKEVERTKAQLSQMGRQIGADVAAQAVETQYKQNLAPMVDATAAELSKSQTYQTVRETSSNAYDSVAATGSAAYSTTKGWFSDMPQNEKELEAMVDGWTTSFISWLGLSNGGVHARGRRSFASLSFTGPGAFGNGPKGGGPAISSRDRVRARLVGGGAGSSHPGR